MKRFAIAFLLLLPTAAAFAQQNSTPRPTARITFRSEFLTNLDGVQSKIMALARTTPAEKYSWRPAPDVRSIGEVYMHIAGGNYFLGTFLNVRPPADMPKDLEKITEKEKVLAELQRSFDHIRTISRNSNEADLEKTLMMFGQPTTQRAVYTTMLNHLHEHLGQSIAYARMNGVVPPWSGGE